AAPVRDRAARAAADAAGAAAGTTAVRGTVHDHLHAGTAALQQMARLRAAARATRTAALARALPHVPGWACTTLSAHHNFPLTAGLFDLLVIDLCRGRNYAEEVAGAVQKSVGRGALRCEGSAGIGIVAEGRLFLWGHRAPVREAKTMSGTRRKAGLLWPEVEGYRVWLGPSGLHPLVGPTHAQGSGSRRGLVVG
ncbi:MAG: hypothetical protein HHJ13_03830, partial [Phycicoccus sp.]|nr:hypothetical protein [Phycicoccus sp.]